MVLKCSICKKRFSKVKDFVSDAYQHLKGVKRVKISCAHTDCSSEKFESFSTLYWHLQKEHSYKKTIKVVDKP